MKSIDADWFGVTVPPGEGRATSLDVGETYLGATVRIAVHVRRALEPGPVMLVIAAVHGDEINGTGAIRDLITSPPFELVRGTLVCVPVINPFGFERHSRYLPDRRDLNRSFPGSREGSLASRLASAVFRGLIKRADVCIDLHTAAARRTNYPNVRAHLEDPPVARLARDFGAEVILGGRGPEGSLRRAACDAGVPTIVFEAGETSKVEPAIADYAVRGVRNCMIGLEMIDGTIDPPAFRLELDRTAWMRANVGGFLRFHVAPGDAVEKDDVIATNTTLLGEEIGRIVAPWSGIIIGMATNPSVAPGDPVVHLGSTTAREGRRIERAIGKLENEDLESRVRDDLSRNMQIEEPPDHEPTDEADADDPEALEDS